MKGKKLVDNVNRLNRGSLIVIERTNKNEIHLFQVLTVGWYGFTMFFPLKSFLPHEWLFQYEFFSITSRLRPWEWNRLWKDQKNEFEKVMRMVVFWWKYYSKDWLLWDGSGSYRVEKWIQDKKFLSQNCPSSFWYRLEILLKY